MMTPVAFRSCSQSGHVTFFIFVLIVAALYFDNFMGGDKDFADLLLLDRLSRLLVDTSLDQRLDLVLVAGVRLHSIPF